MSELYEHLKRLEGKEQRRFKEGVPLSVPGGGASRPSPSKRSRLVVFGLPIAVTVLGLITLLMVTMWTKTRSEATKKASNAASEQAPAKVIPSLPVMESVEKVMPKTEAETDLKPLASLEQDREEGAGMEGIDGGIARPDGTLVQKPVPSKAAKEALQVMEGESMGSSPKRATKERSSSSAGFGPKPISDKETSMEASRQVLLIAEEARRAGHWEGAERGYREYLKMQRDPFVMNNLGALLMSRGRWAEAEQILSQAYQKSRDPEIAVNLTLCLWYQGKTGAACDLAVSVQNDPAFATVSPTLHRLLSRCPAKP